MPLRTHLACFAAAALFLGGLPAFAQDVTKPLRGEVRKREGSSRLPRPSLPAEETKDLPPAMDAATFDLKAASVKPLEGLSAFDQWPGAGQTPLKAKPLIPGDAAGLPAPTPTPRDPPSSNSFAGGPNADALSVISKYSVFLLLDQSGSMMTPDCFGSSRWSWCERETRNFATTTEPVLKGIDLTLFAHSYRDHGIIHADKLHEVFLRNRPGGGTNLFQPLLHLASRLAWGYQRGISQPAIIAVITDGEPSDRDDVGDLVVQLTNQIPKGLVKIVFLKVGESVAGDDFIRELDDASLSRGAKYDMVDGKSFDYLRAHGLLRTLVDSVAE